MATPHSRRPLYTNTLRQTVPLGRYGRMRIELLETNNIYWASATTPINLFVSVETYHVGVANISQPTGRWTDTLFHLPYFSDSSFTVEFRRPDDKRLTRTVIPMQAVQQSTDGRVFLDITRAWAAVIPPEGTHTISPISTVVLRFTPLPPFYGVPSNIDARLCRTCTFPSEAPQELLDTSPGSNLRLKVHTGCLYDPNYSAIQRSVQFTENMRNDILAAIKSGRRLDLGLARCRLNGKDVLIKYGSNVTLAEAGAMQFVSRAQIPVPVILYRFRHDGKAYIVMELIEGSEQLVNLAPHLNRQQMNNLAVELAGYVRQLRQLFPNRYFGSWPSGPYGNVLYDPPPLLAFQTIQELNSYWIWRLGNLMTIREIPPSLQTIAGSPVLGLNPVLSMNPGIVRQGSPTQPVTTRNPTPFTGHNRSVLTHGDLSPKNIMVKDGKITCIINWDAFGWYPEYWEQMLAAMGSSGMSKRWRRALARPNAFGREIPALKDYEKVISEVMNQRV